VTSSAASGVYGGSPSGSGYGVAGRAGSGSGIGAPTRTGTFGDSDNGYGVLGLSKTSDGVHGASNSSANSGVAGINNASGNGVYGGSGGGDGVVGASSSTSGGVAVRGEGNGATWGVYGISATGNGVFGTSAGAGVWGESTGYDAVHGHTSNPNGNTSGVAGFGDGHNYGVFGVSNSGPGVFGTGGGAGIWGESSAADGVHGHSSYGTSLSSGVAGFGDGTSHGVFGASANGVGVSGHSDTGYGMGTDSSTTQARDQSGWVKAMALIDDGGSGTILRCFNSQLPAPQASSPPCGLQLSVSPGLTGSGPWVGGVPWTVSIDLGFKVDDRFIAVTPLQIGSSDSPTTAQVFFMNGNVVTVSTQDSGGNGVSAQFFIVVF
jgi:hypothetical protein